MDDDCGPIGAILGRGNRSNRIKHASVTVCPPQIPHDLIRARIRVADVGSQRLTARPSARRTESTYLISTYGRKGKVVPMLN
jgi:hypothetical protein